MIHYRLYFLDSRGHISRALDMECRDDADAVARALEQAHPFAIELWQGARMVSRLDPDGDAAAWPSASRATSA